MPIPSLDKHGLLPSGVYDCSLQEISEVFATNKHRGQLFGNLLSCLHNEIRPLFDSPIYINGSFVTDKDHPEDVDVALELEGVSDKKKLEALVYMNNHQNRLLIEISSSFLDKLGASGGFRFFHVFPVYSCQDRQTQRSESQASQRHP